MTRKEFINILIYPINKDKLTLHSFKLTENRKIKFGVLMSYTRYAFQIINYVPGLFKVYSLYYKEITNRIFDSLALIFAHKHTSEEVMIWFKKPNYLSLFMADEYKPNGFNIVGIKQL